METFRSMSLLLLDEEAKYNVLINIYGFLLKTGAGRRQAGFLENIMNFIMEFNVKSNFYQSNNVACDFPRQGGSRACLICSN